MMRSNPQETAMHLRKLAVAAVLGAGALALSMQWTFARSAASRMQPVPDTTPLSAGMLRRIAEAADGYRTGHNVWFVINETAPYEIVGDFSEPPGAPRAGTRVVGPFRTAPDFGNPAMFVPVPHAPPTRYGFDSLLYWSLPREPLAMQEIDSIVVTAFRRGGEAWLGSCPGRDIDAVLFSLESMEMF